MIQLRRFNTREELVVAAADCIGRKLARPGSLMLSGGSTPYVIYRRLAGTACRVHAGRRIFLSDERMVPLDSPDSNTGNLIPMLQALDCEDRMIRVPISLPAAQAAEQYGRDLEPLEYIDLGLLGMGADGHTAGFFTPEAAAMQSGPLAVHTLRPDGLEGVTVTPALFRRMEKILLLVTGEAKREIILRLLNDPSAIPAGIALAGHPAAELWTDLPGLDAGAQAASDRIAQ
jgi:6-phosphogluconolactonase